MHGYYDLLMNSSVLMIIFMKFSHYLQEFFRNVKLHLNFLSNTTEKNFRKFKMYNVSRRKAQGFFFFKQWKRDFFSISILIGTKIMQ